MKIMQIVPKMDLGGVERGVLDLAKYFKNKQDKIIVVSGGGRLVKDLEISQAKHYKLNVYRKSPISLFLIRKLRKIIEKENIDIVHARSRVPAWISFFATRNSTIDFITTAHGFYSKHFFSEVMGWGKFVICPSKAVGRHMQERFGVSSDKIVIINRWVDLDKFRFLEYKRRSQDISIICIGRISPSKGYEYLIEAIRRIVRTNPYVNLNIVGSPDTSKLKYLSHLKSLVTRYSLNYNVKFLGYCKDIGNLLARCHILVAPSVIEESFGRVIVEAFACGVPVIATKIKAFAEIIEDKKDGILVAPKDSGALSTAILDLLNNSNLASQIAVNARKKVERFYSFSKCISKIEEVYSQTKKLKRIMVIKISSLGDIILAIPSLKAIKDNFTKSIVTVLTLKKYAALFYFCPYVDKVISLDDNYKTLKYIFKITKELRRHNFDYIIDFQNNYSSHLITFLSFPQKSFGYSRKLGFLLTLPLKLTKERIGPLESQEKILSVLGVRFKDKRLTFWPTKEISLEHLGLFKKDNLIGINISASKKWLTKNWPVSHTIKFIELIHRELPHFKIVLVGEQDTIDLAKVLEAPFRAKLINLCGKTTLKDLIGVLRMLKIFISQDTAPLHLSCALGVQTIGLFGPTDPKRHAVASDNLHIIFKELPCSFCYKTKCKSNKCMDEITPKEVFLKVKEVLKK